MSKENAQLPRTDRLAEIVVDMLNENGYPTHQLGIVDRVPNEYSSSYPSEIVDCRLPDGRTLKLFCKFSADWDEKKYSHRRDLAYEGHVYEHVIRHADLTAPLFYGLYCDRDSTVLVLEYLEHALLLNEVQPRDAMRKAAKWIGTFHHLNEAKARENKFPALLSYNHEYYAEWVERTLKMARELAKTDQYPWLEPLCKGFENKIEILVDTPPTVIHAEYYPINILFQNSKIYPIDWQSAAVACGAIDLASLTEWWGDTVEEECMKAYKSARWPNGVPDYFDLSFLLSKLYWQFRWLGRPLSHTNTEINTQRFASLFLTGKKAGFI